MSPTSSRSTNADQKIDSIDCGNGLRCIRLEPGRYDDVIVHLRNNFFADEPLNVAFGLAAENEMHVERKRFLLETMKHNVSCIIVDENGKIVGAALNAIMKKGEHWQRDGRLQTDDRFKKMMDLLFVVGEKIDLFAKYGVDELFECRFLSVDRNYRGKGLASVLVQQRIRIAQSARFKIMKAIATGLFSAKALLKHGFEVLYEIPYSEVEEYLKPEPPHEAVKLMIKVLE